MLIWIVIPGQVCYKVLMDIQREIYMVIVLQVVKMEILKQQQ